MPLISLFFKLIGDPWHSYNKNQIRIEKSKSNLYI